MTSASRQDEKRDAREAKVRAARAARAEAKAGRGTVEDTPEEASKARAQVSTAVLHTPVTL